jgi:hypothetical protein
LQKGEEFKMIWNSFKTFSFMFNFRGKFLH